MIWGGISSKVRPKYLLIIHRYFGKNPDGYWILMDDNPGSHVSKKFKFWKDENVPLNIDHPPYSPY